jgi:hypothetical protein
MHFLWQERACVAAAANDFTDNGGTDVREIGTADEEQGVHAVPHDVVELRNGFFVVEIGSVAQAADEKFGADVHTIVSGEVFKIVNPHFRLVFENLAQPFHALFEAEQVFFLGIDPDSHYDLIEQGQCAAHDFYMAGGDGVERPGKDSDFFHHTVNWYAK